MNVFEYGDKSAKLVLIEAIGEHSLEYMEKEVALIRENAASDFRLVAFEVADWNKDLSPWEAPAVFGDEGFGDGAAETLAEILKYCEDKDKTYVIGGYSLAGLFALWAAHKTDVFSGVCAASPSMWFPGFDVFMRENPIKSDNIYLSLGNKEEKARNHVMATVGDRMRSVYAFLEGQKINCTLEWNEGNHFRDPDIRIAKGFSWVISQL